MSPSDATIIPLGPRRVLAELHLRSDDELMLLAASGLCEAFDELVTRYQSKMRAFCSRMLKSTVRGDDVAQEVFLEIWRTRQRYQAEGRFQAFLFTAARNRCLRAIRDQRPREPDDTVPLAAPADQLDTLLEAEHRRRVLHSINQLSPKLREAIWLRFSAGLGFETIAEVTHIPVETARSRVFLGLKRLRALLGDEKRSDP
jgi:RNA polymerase sigma-70 factor (ECF subfamily)